MNGLKKVLDFLNRLDEHGLVYSIEHNREETLSVLVAVPGERWEVEFRAGGEVEVEVFYSGSEQEDLEGEEALDRLFADYEDEELDDEEEYEDDEYEYEDDDEEYEDDDEHEYEDDEDEEQEESERR